MDRIYTAFVSSTYSDLRDERELVADQLLGHSCMPIGMEFFPSSRQSLPSVIADSIARSDLYILVIAGRYGTLSPSGRSWTEEEFNRAMESNKEVIALIHEAPDSLPVERVDIDSSSRALLQDFRQRVKNSVTWLPWRNETELVGAVSRSVADCIRRERIHGWVRAGDSISSLQPEDFDRTYLLTESTHHYRLSMVRPGSWDSHYCAHRIVKGHWSEGLARLTIDFDRGTDAIFPFNEQYYPRLSLRPGWSRSDAGTVALSDEPRKSTGSSFAQDVKFDPPIRRDEVVDFWIDGVVEGYRAGSLEDLIAMTQSTVAGRRSYDVAARRIAFPTKRLIIRAFLPDELGATPMGPRVGRSQVVPYPEEEQRIVALGAYREEHMERDGDMGVMLSLDLENPRMFGRYRLTWMPPSKQAKTSSDATATP